MTHLDLPISLIKELLQHLNIVDLDRIQPAVNRKGKYCKA